jgi:hypothetical protein
VLLEEQLTCDARRRAHKRHRAAFQVFEDQRTHESIKAYLLDFGGASGGVDHTFRVGNPELGRLVLPEAVEDRVTDVTALRPLGEAHFDHHLRLDPLGASRGGIRGAVEGTLRRGQRCEPFLQDPRGPLKDARTITAEHSRCAQVNYDPPNLWVGVSMKNSKKKALSWACSLAVRYLAGSAASASRS